MKTPQQITHELLVDLQTRYPKVDGFGDLKGSELLGEARARYNAIGDGATMDDDTQEQFLQLGVLIGVLSARIEHGEPAQTKRDVWDRALEGWRRVTER